MKRVIVDNSKLTGQILDLLAEKFPDGYDYDDVISFRNAKNKEVKAVEVQTEDTIFLVKISSELENSIEAHLNTAENEEDEDDGKNGQIKNEMEIEEIEKPELDVD